MKQIDDKFKFESTGREFYANGYIGAYKSENGIDIAQGYDGYISFYEDGESSCDMYEEEMVELADYMIGIWTEFKNQIEVV